jgi:hypothetical protein
MLRFIQTLALGAALVTLITCIWRDYGVLAAVPRVAIAYLATFFLGALLALGGRFLADAANHATTPAAAAGKATMKRRRRERPPAAQVEPAEPVQAGSSPEVG